MINERSGSAARLLAFSLLLAAVFLGAAGGEEAAARAGRLDGLIESLNASSERRAGAVESIYKELRGSDAREMQALLREALSRSESAIVLGAVEALARLGQAGDVADLDALLATSRSLEVRNLILRLLPAFCLGASERARMNYIHYASGYERLADPSILAPLRHPPLTRRGRLDADRERLQIRILRILIGQFDPVGAAIRYIDDRLYGRAAREAVIHFVGNSLGSDPGLWARTWAAQGAVMETVEAAEMDEIRLSALESLSDLGAEGLPEVIEALRRLMAGGGPVLIHASLDTMAVMCRTVFAEYRAIADMRLGDDSAGADTWRRRRFASAAGLAVFVAGAAGAKLARDADSAGFVAAAGCLGAALSFPAGLPDAEGKLAAVRAEGLVLLEQLLMMPDLSREKRSAAAAALGEIGAVRAVSALASLIASPYVSPDAGLEGMRLAEAAINSLRASAVGDQPGRDAARAALLELLGDGRIYPPVRSGTPPVGMAHLALWRLQRLARSTDTSIERNVWRERLGW